MIRNEKLMSLAKKILAVKREMQKPENRKFKEFVVMTNLKGNPVFRLEFDGDFRAIVVGDSCTEGDGKGYMYLWYSNDETEKYPTATRLFRMLKAISDEEPFSTFEYHGDTDRKKQRSYYKGVVEKMIAEL